MEWSKKAVITRPEVMRSLVAASVGAMMPVSISGTSEPVHGTYDFAPVRERILKAVANGQATGVAVAVAQGGRIVWEELHDRWSQCPPINDQSSAAIVRSESPVIRL